MRKSIKRILMTSVVTAVTALSVAMPTDAATKGDANNDGKMNIRDAAIISKMVSQSKGIELPVDSDFNGDGKVDIRDAAAIAKSLSYVAPPKTTTAKAAVTTKVTAKKSSSVKTTTAKAVKGIPSTVYITPTGKKYHYSSSCNGGKYRPVTYQEAIKKGLKPCNKCVL